MCTEYKTIYMYSGGGCKIGECDKIEYTADPCPDKPTSGIRNCHKYKMVHAASTRRKGPRPGHDHGNQKPSSISAQTANAPSFDA
ncbi:hypothetical protein I7I48_02710 [Histoplasma ohiense]|nr:hypothetical protein I7I48_02710 [Histoplasma ohiense (nom. inval.)]